MSTTGFKGRFVRVFIYILLTLTAITSIYPIIWIIMSSFNPGTALYSTTLIPKKFTLAHYTELFVKKQFGLWYMNTLKIAFFTMLLSVILVVATAYALSQFRFKGRRFGLMTMLVLQAFPGFMTMIAVYLLLLQLNLLDTHLGLILVYSGGAIPGGAWLVKGYFDGIPRSLPEAAKIDGAGNMTIFLKVMMPLSMPILTFIALSNFIAPWMDFILARLVLRSADKKTLAIGLYEMVTGRMNTEFTMFAAGAVMVAIPITILFMFLQKYIIQGLTEGASKS
ncbi:MAG: arabinogalactan oligomer / maltooligosaccharide transport system permease protein [Petroclostridium sp.]|jgi:arabinogalactan oligomer/maltooligosaccharide transport system permease protein|nr:sugar transporter permease [Clostridia bacterium]MDK2809380.1 arabinogalactan oligomer / maltooligosaccharide transport system permease protein [Petroclostridium sp.]